MGGRGKAKAKAKPTPLPLPPSPSTDARPHKYLQGSDAAAIGEGERRKASHRAGDGWGFAAWLHLLCDALH